MSQCTPSKTIIQNKYKNKFKKNWLSDTDNLVLKEVSKDILSLVYKGTFNLRFISIKKSICIRIQMKTHTFCAHKHSP
jgi:hypothetical protein